MADALKLTLQTYRYLKNCERMSFGSPMHSNDSNSHVCIFLAKCPSVSHVLLRQFMLFGRSVGLQSGTK